MLLSVGKPHHDWYCSPVQPGCGPDIESCICGCRCAPLHGGWLLHAAGTPLLGHGKANVAVCYKMEPEPDTHMDSMRSPAVVPAKRSVRPCRPTRQSNRHFHVLRLYHNRSLHMPSFSAVQSRRCRSHRHGGRAQVPSSARAIERQKLPTATGLTWTQRQQKVLLLLHSRLHALLSSRYQSTLRNTARLFHFSLYNQVRMAMHMSMRTRFAVPATTCKSATVRTQAARWSCLTRLSKKDTY